MTPRHLRGALPGRAASQDASYAALVPPFCSRDRLPPNLHESVPKAVHPPPSSTKTFASTTRPRRRDDDRRPHRARARRASVTRSRSERSDRRTPQRRDDVQRFTSERQTGSANSHAVFEHRGGPLRKDERSRDLEPSRLEIAVAWPASHLSSNGSNATGYAAPTSVPSRQPHCGRRRRPCAWKVDAQAALKTGRRSSARRLG